MTTGDQFNVTCRTTRNSIFSNSALLEVTWLDPSNRLISGQSDLMVTGNGSTTNNELVSELLFSLVRASQAGSYSCVVNMTVPGVVTNYTVLTTLELNVRSKWTYISILATLASPPTGKGLVTYVHAKFVDYIELIGMSLYYFT